jgi:BolA family transcriptional regulator, general stress-responsive regulator
MTIADRIRSKLEAALQPARLVIHDDSHRHAGHHGARPEGETHFRLEIVAAALAGQNRVQRQRTVYGILAEELAERVHALQLTTLAPDEAGSPAPPPPACH